MKKIFIFCLSLLLLSLASCTENYSNGERIGLISKFAKTGYQWKSWEGHLNPTQTGMNSANSSPLDFSIDNDNEPEGLVKTIDSAANFGWLVELTYHETQGKNWFNNRGHTNDFVTKCTVRDRTPIQSAFNGGNKPAVTSPVVGGVVRDTIFVVIMKK